MLKNILKKLKGGEKEENGDKMTTFTYAGRTYYTTRAEVENARRKGDVVYYSERQQAYYIRRPSNQGFFSRWF